MGKNLVLALPLSSNGKTVSTSEDTALPPSMGALGLVAQDESFATTRAFFSDLFLTEHLSKKFGMTHSANYPIGTTLTHAFRGHSQHT